MSLLSFDIMRSLFTKLNVRPSQLTVYIIIQNTYFVELCLNMFIGRIPPAQSENCKTARVTKATFVGD